MILRDENPIVERDKIIYKNELFQLQHLQFTANSFLCQLHVWLFSNVHKFFMQSFLEKVVVTTCT